MTYATRLINKPLCDFRPSSTKFISVTRRVQHCLTKIDSAFDEALDIRLAKMKPLHVLTWMIVTFYWYEIGKAVDLTTVSGTTGSSVVKACVSRIRDSGIFPEDFDFLRNLAYVDSNDGADLVGSQPLGGIWKLSTTTFTQMANSSFDVSTYYAAINSFFGISWDNVVYENLSIPLYSALARRMHVAYLQTSVTNQALDTESNQAIFWAVYITDSGETSSSFSSQISSISTGCDTPDRDVVFMIDSSNSAGDDAVDNSANFVSGVISRLKVNTNQGRTVVALGQFSNAVENLSYLNSSKTESEFTAILSNHLPPSGELFTGFSLNFAMANYFMTANGARSSQTGTPRIMCVLLSGATLDQLTNIETVANTNSVNVVAVAMTSNVPESELSLIATGDDTATAVNPSSFPPGTDVQFRVKNQICSTSSVLIAGVSVSGSLQQNEERSFAIQAGVQSVFSVTSGDLVIYTSSTIRNPSSAYYNQSYRISSTNQAVSLSRSSTASISPKNSNSYMLYVTIQDVSGSTTSFTIDVNDPDASSATVIQSGSGADGGLSSGEVAAIAFSCLVLVCATIVAVVYYRFGRTAPSGSRRLRKDSLGKSSYRTKEDRVLEINVRERMQMAMMKRSYTQLNEAVEDFIAMRLEDYDGDFVKAQRMLAVHQCKQGLSQAVTTKNVKVLEKAINKAKRIAHEVDFKLEIIQAEILLSNLKKVENLLRRLKRAIDSEDEATAEAAIVELRVLRGCDRDGAKRMLLAFQLREDIDEAMNRRDINELRDCLSRIRDKRLETELAYELQLANKMEKDLGVVERARAQVMGLKQSMVTKITSHDTPPAGLHEVMMSVYLLLGYHPMQLQSWTAIQSLMGKTGREGLRRMIGELEIRNVDVMHARMAKSLIENFDLETVQELSEALALFYLFAKSVITEVHKLLPDNESPSFFEESFNTGYGSTRRL